MCNAVLPNCPIHVPPQPFFFYDILLKNNLVSGAKGVISLLASVSIFHVLLSKRCALAHSHVCAGMQMRLSQLQIDGETHLRLRASLNDAASCSIGSFFCLSATPNRKLSAGCNNSEQNND